MQLEKSAPRSGTTARFVRTDAPPDHAIHLATGDASLLARMRDLEELAAMACEANERLEQELAEARDQLGTLQRLMVTLEESADQEQQQMAAQREELARELAEAREHVAGLQRMIVALEESAEPLAPASTTPVSPVPVSSVPAPLAAVSAPVSPVSAQPDPDDEPVAQTAAPTAFHSTNPFAAAATANDTDDTDDTDDNDDAALLLQPPRRALRPWLYVAGALVAGGVVAALISPGRGGHASEPPPVVLHVPAPAPAPPAPPVMATTTAPAAAAPGLVQHESVAAPVVTIPTATAKPAGVRTAAPAHRVVKRSRRLASKHKAASARPAKESAKRGAEDPLAGLPM